MRIPFKINKNTYVTYVPSSETLILVGESGRKVLAEDFHWDDQHYPALTALCVEALEKDFANKPILDELPCQDRDYLLEILDVNLPLELVIPLIDEEIYWQRRYHGRFGEVVIRKPQDRTWKSLYIGRHIQDIIEQAQPEHNDEDNMNDILIMCAPFIRELQVTQLQAWKPPLQWDPEDIPEFWPTDHINFQPILKQLVNVEELDIVYGMNNVSDNFKWRMFDLSVLDCQRLGTAINYLQFLRVLKVHRSKLEDAHLQALMQGFISNETVEELDLSHCHIGDRGTLCIAKILLVHPALRILNLCDNKIKKIGTEGLGFALLQPECMLEKLNLKLNPLGEDGAMGILRALVRDTKLIELSMAACQYENDAPLRTGQMLILNTSLRKLDVSNNWFDVEGGQSLVDGLAINRTLEWLDVRETDITAHQRQQIKQLLQRNRFGVEHIEEFVVDEEIELEYEEESEYEASIHSQKSRYSETQSVMSKFL